MSKHQLLEGDPAWEDLTKGIERALQHLTTRKHLSQCRKNQAWKWFLSVMHVTYCSQNDFSYLTHVCIKWKGKSAISGRKKKKDVGTEWNWKKEGKCHNNPQVYQR